MADKTTELTPKMREDFKRLTEQHLAPAIDAIVAECGGLPSASEQLLRSTAALSLLGLGITEAFRCGLKKKDIIELVKMEADRHALEGGSL